VRGHEVLRVDCERLDAARGNVSPPEGLMLLKPFCTNRSIVTKSTATCAAACRCAASVIVHPPVCCARSLDPRDAPCRTLSHLVAPCRCAGARYSV
jgi:hypothetical protein